ncbi:hypothetical protein AGABI2DRAFT_140700 [Agaricus bisporus var. bisporus H97]|uniref:hypothetical protein n=1 Tax=Agaricus bisporus var. bisporus (strain H97 / ATCC MYA-4626 / FGSC 10389) TaxID=936046 RepID=UPI00029F6B68|nr:hypothetical protein AGABI2DRAFT_140698 [Agaricus bisporus var. bisporus H97]XP_006454868.1 hypothetical protein AGABI2DRAFT_140700 [Agaricus bisporus var. bisporus H97]EKV51889.1 hypothetical protein AGABI2DRAFT_140698 [Agaricus bisporus var. bisporus H97]EKV51891.1 hypothetical protein AGABI2DRAFT_140700 [Agaricus bisporus var. bisporus H97]
MPSRKQDLQRTIKEDFNIYQQETLQELEKTAEHEHLRLLQQLQPKPDKEDEQIQQTVEENHHSEKEDEDEPTSRLSLEEEEELANKLANMSTNDTFRALIPDPGKFEGSREKFEDWWRSIQLFLTFNKVTTDNDKIIACISRMHNGTAGALAALIADRINGNNKITWKEFEKEMKEAFIDGKEKEKSEVAIETLVQGRRPIIDYLVEFNLLKNKVGTDDQHAVFLLKKNVRKDIIRTILSFPPTNLPTNLAEWTKVIKSVGIGAETMHMFDKHTSSGVTYGGSSQPMEIDSKREILLDANIRTKNGTKTVKALIDSGAHMTLVAKGLVKKENLEKTKRQQPIKMRNADGTPNRNGKLTEDARIQMDLGGHKEEIKALDTTG